MPAFRTTALAIAAMIATQACAKESQTDKAVETKTADGQLSASISGDSADKRGVALVRVVNAAATSKDMQVRADDQRMFPAVKFKEVSIYTPIDQAWATFQVGDSSTSAYAPLNTNRELLTDGHRYTIVVLRSEDGSTYETKVFKDVIENEAGKARLRVIHAAPGAGEIEVSARSGEKLFSDVDYGDEDGFKSIAPWTGVIDVKSKDGKTTLFSTKAMTLDAGKSYTMVVTRTAKGKLEAFWFEDQQVM
jgi:hypothetical protein